MLDLNEIEILQVALAHEGRAKAFYERLARRRDDAAASDLFVFLAAEEEGHIRRLSARYGMPAFEAAWETKYLPHLIDLDRLAREDGLDGAGLRGAEAARKGLAVARKAEAHAIEFYRNAAGVVGDATTRELLAELEAEEKIHLGRIERLLAESQ